MYRSWVRLKREAAHQVKVGPDQALDVDIESGQRVMRHQGNPFAILQEFDILVMSTFKIGCILMCHANGALSIT